MKIYIFLTLVLIFFGCKEQTFLKNVRLDKEKYQTTWGIEGKFTNYIPDTFKYIGNYGYTEVCFGKKAIVLEQLCGSECKNGIILPLSAGAKPKILDGFFSGSCEYDILVFIQDLEEDLQIYILNTLADTLMIDTIKYSQLCNAAIKRSCIDSISINKSEVTIMYQGSNFILERKDNRLKKIKI